ncbi:hypothetical protein [Kordiimonas marina]|uniref:hypothetical protein n=1 Tax=Kordiimonas marina TaxID=2872312 RepID=UPI001FF43C27|nr:hypothetical protein [Kordiimonas marina]MCJ9428074.1 hypothetical protein [Kordiimonas marina]
MASFAKKFLYEPTVALDTKLGFGFGVVSTLFWMLVALLFADVGRSFIQEGIPVGQDMRHPPMSLPAFTWILAALCFAYYYGLHLTRVAKTDKPVPWTPLLDQKILAISKPKLGWYFAIPQHYIDDFLDDMEKDWPEDNFIHVRNVFLKIYRRVHADRLDSLDRYALEALEKSRLDTPHAGELGDRVCRSIREGAGAFFDASRKVQPRK